MAGKMQNYLNWFQRHHTSEEYSALVAGDVKIQKFLNRQNKIPAIVRALDDLSRDIGKKVMLPAIQKASDFLASIEKSAAPTDAGTLKQSIGSNKAKYYPATFCGFVASGPRRGYARAVQVVTSKKGKQRLKRLSKKFTNTTPTTLRIKNPLAYAWFVMHGRKAAAARGKGSLPIMASGGTFFRHSVHAAPAHDFMATAQGSADSAANMATEEMNQNLAKLLQ